MKTERKIEPLGKKMKRIATTGAGKRTQTVTDRFAAMTVEFQFVNVHT